MSLLSLAQRIAFGQYINDEVFPKDKDSELGHKCPFATDATDKQRLDEKDERYQRIVATMARSKAFLSEISSWKRDKNLGLGSDFETNLDNRISDKDNAYDLEKVLGMVFRAVNSKIENIFRNPSTQLVHAKGEKNWEAISSDPRTVQGGMLNAVATQLGWSFATIKKMAGQARTDIEKTLDLNIKSFKSLIKMQFSLFNMTLNELGVRTFPFLSFHKFDDSKFELLETAKGNKVLVPTEKVILDVIEKAKKPDAHAIMQGGSPGISPKMFLRDSSMPKACLAEDVSLDGIRDDFDKDLKANILAEFLDYMNCIVKDLVIPKLGQIKITEDN